MDQDPDSQAAGFNILVVPSCVLEISRQRQNLSGQGPYVVPVEAPVTAWYRKELWLHVLAGEREQGMASNGINTPHALPKEA